MNTKTKACLKLLIEDTIGETIDNQILSEKSFYIFNHLILNDEDTLLYLDLLKKYNLNNGLELKEMDFGLEIISELVEERIVVKAPRIQRIVYSKLSFGFVTRQWEDDCGRHVVIAVKCEDKYSEPAIFDLDGLLKRFSGTLN